jgi:hypothetical protein
VKPIASGRLWRAGPRGREDPPCIGPLPRPPVGSARLREYAVHRGLEATEYVDHEASGTRAHRRALDALLRAVRRREVDLVAVTKLDRIGRSASVT